MNVVNREVEAIVDTYKGTMHFVNFEVEDIRDKQKFPFIGSMSETAGYSNDFKIILTDVTLFIVDMPYERAVEDTDKDYENAKRNRYEDMKETLKEIYLVLSDKYNHIIDGEILFDVFDEAETNMVVVRADTTMQDKASFDRTIRRFDI